MGGKAALELPGPWEFRLLDGDIGWTAELGAGSLPLASWLPEAQGMGFPGRSLVGSADSGVAWSSGRDFALGPGGEGGT